MKMFRTALAAVTMLAAASLMNAQDDKKVNLTGSWKLSMHGDHVIPGGLALEQDGTKIKGTFMFMGKDIPVEGEYAGGVLKLTSNAKLEFRGPGGAEGHGAAASEGTKLTIDGKMTDDGTLAGTMPGPRGNLEWSAERFRERKVPAAQKPKPAAVNVSGSWNAVTDAGQGSMKIGLALKQDGNKITGTMKSDHIGEVPLEGMIANGTLVFFANTNAGGAGSVRLECSATIKDDGSLIGELAAPMGKMPWTAERAK